MNAEETEEHVNSSCHISKISATTLSSILAVIGDIICELLGVPTPINAVPRLVLSHYAELMAWSPKGARRNSTNL